MKDILSAELEQPKDVLSAELEQNNNYLYGELNQKVEQIKYKGGETATASVIVDNTNNTIYANVDTEGIIDDERHRAMAVESTLQSEIDIINGVTIPNTLFKACQYTDTELGKLDFDLNISADESISNIHQNNGQVSAVKQKIQVVEAQVTGLPEDLALLNDKIRIENRRAVAEETRIENKFDTVIDNLDYSIDVADDYTIKSIAQTDGQISVEKQPIQIAQSQVDNLPNDLDTIREDLADEIVRAKAAEQTLSGGLAGEVEARIAADGVLQDNIDAEESSRISADATLQANIDNEESARIAADATLQDNIDAEESTRVAADDALQENIDNEELARIAADDTLQANIDVEASARESADNTLQSNIDAEESARIAAINSEISERSAADALLQSNIDTEEAARIAKDSDLQGQIDAITSSTDVVDVVAVYDYDSYEEPKPESDIVHYDTSGLFDKSIVKVLQDETKNNAISYYRWHVGAPIGHWTHIGVQGPFYTKSETDEEINTAVTTERTRALAAEQVLSTNLSAEVTRATEAESGIRTDLTSHTTNTSNPHSVTKSQVGLGLVENKALDTEVTASSENYITSKAVAEYVSTEGGKIDTISLNGDNLPIINKNVDIPSTWEIGTGEHSAQTVQAPVDANNAAGGSSVAIGIGTDAHGLASITEGGYTSTGNNASFSHAEGYRTSAQGQASHTEGDNTVTNNSAEHAEGHYNKSNMGGTDATNTLSSIGIGSASMVTPGGDRKNAFEVMQNGDTYIIGVGDYDGTNISTATTIQTEINNKQDTLVSGTNIKTLNGDSILGSGNLIIDSGKIDTITIDGQSTTIDANKNVDINQDATTSQKGLVPRLPATDAQTKYLRGDNTWAVVEQAEHSNYNTDITIVAEQTDYNIVHNLSTRNCNVVVYDNTTHEDVICDIYRESVDNIKLKFYDAEAGDSYHVCVQNPSGPKGDKGEVGSLENIVDDVTGKIYSITIHNGELVLKEVVE